jgi:hypothetical protein
MANIGAQRLGLVQNGKFYWDFVIFQVFFPPILLSIIRIKIEIYVQVEDELFKVPKHPFMRSPVFETIFSLPRPAGTADGENDDQPFKLEGIRKKDFELLLEEMFPVPWYAQDFNQQSKL